MSTTIIPGIVKIQIILSAQLPARLMLRSICTIVPAISAPAVTVAHIGTPVLKCDGTVTNGTRSEKTTLEFNTTEELPEDIPLAFAVTTAAGKQYLIGTREARHPVIEYTDTTGDTTRTAAVRSYKITHVARKSLIRCIL